MAMTFGDPSKFAGFQAVTVSIELADGRFIHGTATHVQELSDYLNQLQGTGLVRSIASTPVLLYSYN